MAPLNGVYRGPCGIYTQNPASLSPAANLPQAGITAYVTWLGKTVTYVLDYQMSSPDTWAHFTGTSGTGGTGFTLYNPHGAANYTTLDKWCYSGGPTTLGGRTAMLGLSPCAGRSTGSGGTTWAAEAAGTNDTYWTALGNNLVAWQGGVFANAVLRIGREFNYGGYNWSPSTTGDSAASYVAGYQHIVTLLKGIAGNSFKFMWNPALSPGTMGGQAAGSAAAETQSWYPGDAYADSIGLDVYDWGNYPNQTASPWGNRTLAQQQSNFAYLTNAQDALASWNTFAQLHSKQLAFPEWGLQLWLEGGVYIGGGDDPYYVTSMANEMSSNCLMQAMWEDLGMGLFDTDAYASRTAAMQAPDASRTTFLFYFGAGNTGSGGVPYSGAGSLTGGLEEKIANAAVPPGTPPGPGGTGGSAPPATAAGWEIFVRSYADYTTLLCQIPTHLYTSFQFAKMLDDIGSGTVVLNQDDAWWKTAVLGDGSTTNTILDYECLWQIYQDGVCRFEFLGETITEQLVDASEQRIVTITGPGTLAALKWAMAMPQGFPNIVLKLDGLADTFDEVTTGGAGVIDTNIWTTLSPASAIYITPVSGLYTYPGGSLYQLSTLYPSGTLTIQATNATTLLGSSPWDATDTLVSLQISPVGAPAGSATDSNGNPVAYGTGLDGSQLTQVYVESLTSTSCNAGFGLSATEFYVWQNDPVSGYQTHIISSAEAYNATTYAYWMLTEQAGSGGGPGTFYFWTSQDGSTWTQQWTVVHNWNATYVAFFVSATYDTTGQAAVLQSLNANVTTASYQGNIFLGQPIMGIWESLLSTAQDRGTIPFVSTQATASADSFGNPWSDTQNVQVTNGTDLYSLLQSACATVNADYVMQPGFVLQVGLETSSGVSLGTDRSQQIVFREARNELSKQRVRVRGTIQNLIGAENSDGREISASDAASISQWGQREGWFQTSAQVDPVSMEIASAAAVETTGSEVLSWTLSILPNETGKTVFESFDVGDWVGLERPDFSATDAVRVIGIAVAVAQDGTETHELTLISYVQWLQEQLTYISSKLGGAFVNALGTTPVAPSKYGTGQIPTYFTPAASLANLADVVGTGGAGGSPLVYNAAAGTWQSASVTDPVSGSAIPVTIAGAAGTVTVSPTGVAISSSPTSVAPDGGGAVPGAPSTTHTPTSTTVVDATGSTRVVIGQQSDGTVTVVETNGAPPAAPDIPVVTAGVLGVVVGWDGLLGGAAPLFDFKWTEVHVSTATGFTPSSATLQGTMSVGGLFGVGALTAGTTYYVRLLARNKSNVASAASTQATGVPLATGTGAKITTSGTAPVSPSAGDLWYNSSSGNALTQWSGSAWVAVPFGAGAIATGSITSAQIASAAAITGSQLAASANITGSQLSSSAAITGSQLAAAAGITGSQLSGSAGITGTQLANSTITLTQLAGAVTARALGGITTTISTTAPGSPTTGDVWINTTTGTIEQYSGSAWNVVTFNAANAIQAGTITASQILAGTITATQMAANSITATQLAANSITAADMLANTITAGQIAASTITATQIAATTITAAKIAAGTITSAQIATNTITAAELISGIVIAGAVNGTTITGAELIADGAQGQVLIYNGTPGSGNLVGSWSGAAGTDAYGNAYPSGISATTGTFQGAGMEGADISASTFYGGSVTSASISNPNLSGGTISETQITFDQVGGRLLVYSTTTTTVTLTSGTSWTAPAGGYTQGKVECWGGDASGDGGNSTYGGSAGGGAAYSCEPSYPLTPGNVYSTQIGAGGTAVYTGNTGLSGGQTSFDGGGVVSYGGQAASGGTGGRGGQLSGNTIGYAGGNGGNGLLGVASAGGGGRAGSTGNGGNGGNGGSSPGAAGAAGSGTGGHAGGAGAATGTAGNMGGGGSGAGKGGSGTTYQTIYYDSTGTGSYYGSTVGGGLKNTNGSMFQGCSSGDLYVTGDQESFANYNASQMLSDWSAWSVDWVTLTINNQHSWYNTGCYAILGIVTTGNAYNQQQFWCNEGATTEVDVTQILYNQIGSMTALILGPSSSTTGGSTDLYNYGYFEGGAGAGSPRVTVGGHQGTGGSYKSGAGAAGVIKITYVSATNLIGAIAPASGTDGSSNAYAVGYTGQVTAFQPGSSPTVVETWHTISLSGAPSGTTGYARVKMLPSSNFAFLDIEISFTALGASPPTYTIGSLPSSAYYPTTSRHGAGGTGGTPSTNASVPRAFIPAGSGGIQIVGLDANMTAFGCQIMYPLD